MVSALLTVLGLLFVGYWMQRLGRLPSNAAEVLNRFVIDICLPATILRLVPKLSLGMGVAPLVIVPWAIAGLSYVMVRLFARPLGLDATTRTALFLATALGNTSFLGFPLCHALLGEASIPLAAVYDQFGSFLLLSTIAPLALGKLAGGERPRARDLVLRVLGFPPFLALLLALLPLPFPALLDPILAVVAAPLIPVAMVAVGLKLRLTPPRPKRVLALGLALKLLILPAAAWGLAKALGAPPLVTEVAVLETAMPTMVTAGALMMASGVESEQAAAFVGWGLVIALVTVPAWSFLLH